MDRFIERAVFYTALFANYLKSNMDRFIASDLQSEKDYTDI